jgi:predicted acylesterase/phospholipase RssA
VEECKPLVDGGYVNNLPTGVMRAMGARVIIAVDVSGDGLPEAAMKPWGDGVSGRGLHSSTFQLNVSIFFPMQWGALLISVTKTAQVEQRCGRV